LTIPINDPAALAAAAQRLIDQPGLRNRLACGAHRRAAEEFDHLMMARRSLAIYRRAIRGEPAPVMIDPAPVARETSVDDFDLGADLLGLGLLAAGRDQQPDNIPQAVGELRGTNYQNESSAPLFREPLRRD
jgi:hypothetical protein